MIDKIAPCTIKKIDRNTNLFLSCYKIETTMVKLTKLKLNGQKWLNGQTTKTKNDFYPSFFERIQECQYIAKACLKQNTDHAKSLES